MGCKSEGPPAECSDPRERHREESNQVCGQISGKERQRSNKFLAYLWYKSSTPLPLGRRTVLAQRAVLLDKPEQVGPGRHRRPTSGGPVSDRSGGGD